MKAQKLMQEYGSEFDWESNQNFKDAQRDYHYFQGGEYFRSGRDALKAIALKCKYQYRRVLLPSLCCESMVTPFEINGYEVIFYKLKADISADYDDILAKLNSQTIFIYMNYFGITSLSELNLEKIKGNFQNVLLIEDKTHDLQMNRKGRFVPDYTVISIRKWLAIPDGGIIFSTINNETFIKDQDLYFADIRTVALKNKSKYVKSGKSEIKELYRYQFEEANSHLNIDMKVVGISPKSIELLRDINFNKIIKYRIENSRTLSRNLSNILGINCLLSDVEQSPLYYPILLENRDIVQRKLAENKIYCPVIWPLPKNSIGICKVADYISNNMLALPCDQRYGKSDMENISRTLKQILENV
jgi:dTDP-4-amino-4,6-dideoxygalactose transaminase